MAIRTYNYTDNEKIITAGSMDQKMYIIIDGEVEIRLREGKDEMTVAILKKNDFFGEMSLFNNQPRTADAIAVGNVKVAAIESVEQLTSFLQHNHGFAAKMVRILANRLAMTDELLMGKVSEVNRMKVNMSMGRKNVDPLFG